ncbi:PTS ascorbate transporter subunit IIC [Corynebacterium diphtheriae]|nr:PTS ascorbate transporter subunit IIC [Corynebacterium diphtheriae]
MSGGGVCGNATGGRRGGVLGGLTNGLVITFLPAFPLGVLGNFGDADFGWFGMLVGGGARVGGRLGIVLVILVGLAGATEGRFGSTDPPFGGISKDFSRYFTPNRKKTGRLSRFGVKCRLFGG